MNQHTPPPCHLFVLAPGQRHSRPDSECYACSYPRDGHKAVDLAPICRGKVMGHQSVGEYDSQGESNG